MYCKDPTSLSARELRTTFWLGNNCQHRSAWPSTNSMGAWGRLPSEHQGTIIDRLCMRNYGLLLFGQFWFFGPVWVLAGKLALPLCERQWVNLLLVTCCLLILKNIQAFPLNKPFTCKLCIWYESLYSKNSFPLNFALKWESSYWSILHHKYVVCHL